MFITDNIQIASYPPWSAIISKSCRFSLLVLKDHFPVCPSVLLKYALPVFFAGGTYQLPHRSLATKGSPYASDTSQTNSESSRIDTSRFDTVNVDRLSDESVFEKFVASSEKTKSEVADIFRKHSYRVPC